MKKKAAQKNRIKELREERDLSSRALAVMIGTSAPHMSRLESGETPLSIEWIRKITEALKVNSGDVIDLPFDKKLTANCDEALLGSTLDWLMEAAEKFKVDLSHKELSHWAGYIYKGAVEEALNFRQTKYLAFTIVKVIAHNGQ